MPYYTESLLFCSPSTLQEVKTKHPAASKLIRTNPLPTHMINAKIQYTQWPQVKIAISPFEHEKPIIPLTLWQNQESEKKVYNYS